MYKCRACLIKCEEDQMSCMDLFDKLPTEFLDVSIAEALSEIASISISPDPYQPSKICSSCCYRLQDAFVFIKRVQESAAIIQQCSSIEYPLPTDQIDNASMLCDVQVKVEREDNYENNDETESVINANCLEDVKITNIYSVTDEPPRPNHTEFIAEDEIKMEPEEGEIFGENALYEEQDFVEDPLMVLDNVQNNQDKVIKCVCRYFHKADYVSHETKSTIQKKFSNMQDFTKNLYIKSLLHICKCGADGKNGKNSKQLERIIYTLECNDDYISVSRDMFIQVFGLKEKTFQLLENLENFKRKNHGQNNRKSSSKKSIKKKLTKEMLIENPKLKSAQPIKEEKSTDGENESNTRIEPQKCMLCGKPFKNIASLKHHVILNHSYCSSKDNEESKDNKESEDDKIEDYPSNGLLQEIKKTKLKRKIKNYALPCCFCLKTFINSAALTSHKRFCLLKNKRSPHSRVS